LVDQFEFWQKVLLIICLAKRYFCRPCFDWLYTW